MVNINRERLLDKIRALLSKTTANGCTEAEALAALGKAREMMDAYEVTADDLRLAKEEAAVLVKSGIFADPNGIRQFLTGAVSRFTGCKVWRDARNEIVFCGAPADVQFAQWLHGNLTEFVRRELATYLMSTRAPKGERRRIINGFVLGCCGRITQRIKDIVAMSQQAASGNSRALVLVKDAATRQVMEANGVRLRKAKSRRKFDNRAADDGRAAGNRASFARPVDGRMGTPLIGRAGR